MTEQEAFEAWAAGKYHTAKNRDGYASYTTQQAFFIWRSGRARGIADERKRLKPMMQEVVEALEFYSNKYDYVIKAKNVCGGLLVSPNKIMDDQGDTAKQALATLQCFVDNQQGVPKS